MIRKTITIISDTHNKHKQVEGDLPGGDILIHCGDLSSVGKVHEIRNFCEWFNKLDDYTHKIFISGNHDFGFERFPEEMDEIVGEYKNITYLKDSGVVIDGINFWGSPWQPEFYNWAFNLPRNGSELKEKWALIPEDTDVLITHGPPFGVLDCMEGSYENLGCELLIERINEIKPKISMFGHIHSGRGIKESNGTLFVNGSVLDERYLYTQTPMTIEYIFGDRHEHYYEDRSVLRWNIL